MKDVIELANRHLEDARNADTRQSRVGAVRRDVDQLDSGQAALLEPMQRCKIAKPRFEREARALYRGECASAIGARAREQPARGRSPRGRAVAQRPPLADVRHDDRVLGNAK